MNILVRFRQSFGRMGSLSSLFVCARDEYDSIIGQWAHFGEALGKHSEISCELSADNLTIVSDDQERIAWLVGVIGSANISGRNPIDYIAIDDEDGK